MIQSRLMTVLAPKMLLGCQLESERESEKAEEAKFQSQRTIAHDIGNMDVE